MKVDQRVQALRASGYRMTRARQAILCLLDETQSPLSAPEIQQALTQKGIHVNKTTVYREILFLLNQQVLAEVDFGDGAKRYEYVDGEHHHHFVCTLCKSVTELSIEKDLVHISQDVLQQTGGKITHHMVEFFGICATCATVAS